MGNCSLFANCWEIDSKLNYNNCNFFLKNTQASSQNSKKSHEKKKIAPVAWMIIIGDALLNFIDGLAIGASDFPVQDILVSVLHLRYSAKSYHMNLVSSNFKRLCSYYTG